MTIHPMSAHLDSLAWHIDRFGYDAVTQQHLHDIRSGAEAAGVRPGLIDVLNDEAAPTSVRNRAFAKVASMLTKHLHTQTPVDPTTATETTVTDDQVAYAA